jgi:hypothetical protein
LAQKDVLHLTALVESIHQNLFFQTSTIAVLKEITYLLLESSAEVFMFFTSEMRKWLSFKLSRDDVYHKVGNFVVCCIEVHFDCDVWI